MPLPRPRAVPSLAHPDSAAYDALIVVSPTLEGGLDEVLVARLRAAAAVDGRVGRQAALAHAPEAPGGRLIHVPTGPLSRDVDDVRAFGDAAERGARLALETGARRPLLLVHAPVAAARFQRAAEVALLGALSADWAPLQARERVEQRPAFEGLGMVLDDGGRAEEMVRTAWAIERGRRLARDLTSGDPERVRPEAAVALCREAFEGTGIALEVCSEREVLERDYPLLSAVARASQAIPRHRPQVLRLTYEPPEAATRTLLLAGKGVTYDTGGADLKAGGGMAGASRDKGGAAAIAGFFLLLDALRPAHLRVVAELGWVRNSVGAGGYVSDEIIRGHSGVRVKVGNTDAEGRMVLADILSHLRTQALQAPGAHLMSVATLTGHAMRTAGPYPIVLDNGPARAEDSARTMSARAEHWGEPLEVSRLRREDYDFIRPRDPGYDVLSCNPAPSAVTNRGHQFPAAFLAQASGLSAHGLGAEQPLPYTHLDLAGSVCEGGDWLHGRPTGTGVLALGAAWVL